MDTTETTNGDETMNTLQQQANDYRNTQLEGGDGYNPHQAKIDDQVARAAASRPVSIGDRLYSLRREIVAIANDEDSTRYDELRSEIASLEAQQEAAFAAAWPRDVTTERRVAWNKLARSGAITNATIRQHEIDQGWTLAELRQAVKYHNL